MNILLVLYPIYPYAYTLIGPQEPYEIKKKFGQIYQRLIDKRYTDFKKIWVMFSDEDYPEKPDMSRLWEGINIKTNDILSACGVTFDDLCYKKIYPNPERIIRICPQPIEKLIIGGFHFWDCVEKTAQYAYENKIDVLVDDDLTEFFFWKVRGYKRFPSESSIPISREKSIEKDRKHCEEAGPRQLKAVRKARKNKPWLIQI